MLDISSLFIGTAWAETANAMPPVTDGSSALMRFMPLFLILGVFYLLLIRPQQKQIQQQNAMLQALKKGDRIHMASGLIGKVSKIDGDKTVMVEIADGVVVEVLRATVTGLYEANNDKTSKK